MDYLADLGEWAESNFAGVDLGDPRRTRRLVDSARLIAAHPELSFPALFDWNQLRGFYRLCDRTEATIDSLQCSHRRLTRLAMAGLPVVLVHHDTTTLDFTSHPALQGAGSIGDGNGTGFLQHNSLAFGPDGRRLLGLVHQQFIARQPAPANESPAARKSRPGRESQLWLNGITAPGQPPEGAVWVDVADRGADDYEAMAASKSVGHEFLFRICQDRKVFLSAALDEEVYLMQYARLLPEVGRDSIDIPGRGGRPGRTACVAMTSAPVWVGAPGGTPKRRSRPILAAWLIRIWEIDPPAALKEPLEWVLLGSMETATLAQIKQKRDWYGCRWGAEVFHDIEKNGCAEEERMFQTAARMEAALAVLSVVAVRVYQLRLAVKTCPEAPAQEVATAEEVEVVGALGKRKSGELTVKDFVAAVAKLGGFLGRKRDGEPGVRTLWRGYQRLQDLVAGFRLHRQNPLNPSG
jgi:Transposase DNA-binding/Transposase Tn5 dimerisation domain